MKVKLAILDSDANYLSRIASVFGEKYSDKLEVYSFTDADVALSTLSNEKIDVFIAEDTFNIDFEQIPRRCGFAYFVDSADVNSVNGQRAICKFQKADTIYKLILSIFSENSGNLSMGKTDRDKGKIIAFASPCGGTGTSSMAAACAIYFAAQGKKVLYMNLERFGASDVFFAADGQFDMSDIIFAVKSKKANLALKLESCVKLDQSGVYFYSSSKIALDMMELGGDEIRYLISAIKTIGFYDYIIVDMDFDIREEIIKIFQQANEWVWVTDGSETSNLKVSRAYASLAISEQQMDIAVTERIALIYNKFSNKTGRTVGNPALNSIGGVPRYEHAALKEVVAHLARNDMFEKVR